MLVHEANPCIHNRLCVINMPNQNARSMCGKLSFCLTRVRNSSFFGPRTDSLMISSFFCPLVVDTLSSWPKELKDRQIPCLRQALYRNLVVYHHVVCLQSINALLLLLVPQYETKAWYCLLCQAAGQGNLDFLGIRRLQAALLMYIVVCLQLLVYFCSK